MEYMVIVIASFLISALTLYSGFGLGTLLMPFFAFFFPVEVSIAITAIVHFLNNLFRLVLLGRHAKLGTALRFGLPAVPAAFLGAYILEKMSGSGPLFTYEMAGHGFAVTEVKLVIAVLIMFFALLEGIPRFENISFDQKYIPIGGLMSGFFGGLSGHQGAFRSAFLIRSGLTKDEFISTSIVVAFFVDIPRLSIYMRELSLGGERMPYLVTAVVSAFLGSLIASTLLRKMEMRVVQLIVSVMLFGTAIALGAGLI